MNLVEIRKRISQYISEGVIDRRVVETLLFEGSLVPKECELWDYKREVAGDAISIAKTILRIVSFYNTYGGYLIYGVDEVDDDKVFVPRLDGYGKIDLQKLRSNLKNYTAESIDITFAEVEVDVKSNKVTLGLLHVPKRPRQMPPVSFGKNGPENKKGECVFRKDDVYLRVQDNCVPARKKEDFQILFGDRMNPYIWDISDVGKRIVHVDLVENNLPDRNFICSRFVGRDKIIQDLWRWLGDPFEYAKVLAGDGGKGKTSIAYEFSEEVCHARPFGVEKVIWLTAKSRQYRGDMDDFVNVPETHYFDIESLLRSVCSELAVLDSEIEGASIPMLKKILHTAIKAIPCLVIVDDVDSVDSDQQRMILETAMQVSSYRARFLLTTRVNFTYSSAACINIQGLEKSDYREYVKTKLEELGGPSLDVHQIEKLRGVTDGSPMFTESLLRLIRAGVPYGKAVKEWEGKLGGEARKAALKREIDNLSMESRRVLLACSYMRESSFTELKQATGYSDERMQLCIEELRSLFLISAPRFIEQEPRFRTANNTALLVLENKNLLVNDPNSLHRVVQQLRKGSRIGERNRQQMRVGAAINQAIALLREADYDAAIATVDAAIREVRDNPDLILMRGRCLLAKYKSTGEDRLIRLARQAFKKAYDHGQRKSILFAFWYESETIVNHPNGRVEVATSALNEGPEFDQAEWFLKRAEAYIQLARNHKSQQNEEAAIDELVNAAQDYVSVLKSAHTIAANAYRGYLFQVHDEIWEILSSRSRDFGQWRVAFGRVKECVLRGDYRTSMFEHLLDVLSNIVQDVDPKMRRVSTGQRNLIQQLARETGDLLDKSASNTRHLLRSRWQQLDEIAATI